MPLPRSWYPRLAGITDATRVISREGVSGTWPPPGTHVLQLGFPEPWGLVVEDTYGSAPSDGTWYVTTLSDFADGISSSVNSLAAYAGRFVTPEAAVIYGTLGQWPVIWEADKGETMKWLRCTFRGDLGGGVEHFQWKIDLGNPGADPTLSEAGALALAEQMAGIFSATFATSSGVSNLRNVTGTDVTYTEVGVVSLVQDDAGGSDGSGGHQTPDYGTQWFAYPSGSQPAGTSTPTLPFEVACAVTTITDHRGPSGRGRFYLPPFGSTMMRTGGVYAVDALGYVGDWVDAFFTAVRSDTPYLPIVVSHRRKILNEITRCELGMVPDSQRRRRRSQDEARVVAWSAA